MRKIINGLRYDTQTAELIGEWGNGHYPGDIHLWASTNNNLIS